MKKLALPGLWAAFAVVSALLAPAHAQGAASADERAVAVRLPVSHVSVYTTGVGYFEHVGTVEGTAEWELTVPAEHMDDLLQSLVLEDLDGGRILPVRYPSRDPLGRILDSYSLDLSGAPTLAQLLAQARGESVAVEAPDPLVGTILGVERVEPTDAAPRDYLTLSTPGGLRRVPLDEVRALRFEREELREELAAALEAVARHRDAEAGRVRLRFEGEGERRVRIGYVREMPVWKTSYRLVARDDGSADLQGWAIIDNPTDVDLVDVSVSFVAGSPASFVTRLYEPVYVHRPRIDVPSGTGPVPEVDAGVLRAPSATPRSASMAESLADDASVGAPAPAPQRAGEPRLEGGGVRPMAEGSATGAAFEYRVTTPVTILRHASAMIPILTRTIPAEAVGRYDARQLANHPSRSFRIENDTGLHLAAGPVTVFDDAGFSGAARMGDVPAGEARLLDFAVDLDTLVTTTAEDEPQRVTAVRLRNGVLETTVRWRVRTRYRIDTGDEARFLILEHPRRSGYEVVLPATPPAVTPEGYRFGVRIESAAGGEAAEAAHGRTAGEVPVHATCPTGTGCEFEVVQERIESQSLAVHDVTPEQILFFLENVELSERDRAVLDRILERKREIVALERSLANAEARLDSIHREQERIRQNMGALNRDSALYARYLADLSAQEDELTVIRSEIEHLRSRRDELEGALEEDMLELGDGVGG